VILTRAVPGRILIGLIGTRPAQGEESIDMTAHYPGFPDQAEAIHADGAPRGSGRKGVYGRLAKRLFDIFAVLAAAPVVLPVVALLALLVARDGHAPFYRQARVGRGGRVFTLWKLRSMVPNAEARLADYLAQNPAARAEWNTTQKLKRDPRITRFGKILRKTSLDELPQLWNVLTGDMSLVGPRPMMPEQEPLYPGRAYYTLRPGITGLWQISDRNETTFAARAEYDADYARALSFGMDMKILLSTVGVVTRGTGY
jgi:exopolysaccharide production protein ExoY